MFNSLKILILSVSLIFLTSCGVIKGSKNPFVNKVFKWINNKYAEDNLIEEKIEDIIEETTGVETDLSPCSPEEEKHDSDSN